MQAVLVDDATGAETELPKVVRWYKAKDSQRHIVHRFAGERHTTPTHGTSVNLALDLSDGRLPSDLDRSWYIAQARRTIQAVPGYRHRSPKRLEGHAGAVEVLGLGLLPCPKWNGKAVLPGSDAAAPTLLWDWSRITTVGTYTGPKAGILVLDIDDHDKFRRWVEKDNRALLGNRWDDFNNALVSVHGDAPADNVRWGCAKGKLIFRLGAGPDHALAKLSVGKWKADRGIEVFYCRGIPSVLGDHPSGEKYRLEGTLTDAPGWLVEGLAPKAKSRQATRPAAMNGKSHHTDPLLVFTESAAPESNRDGVHVEAALTNLRSDLAELSADLAKPSIGWRWKETSEGKVILVGRCPFDHDSGTSGDADLSAGIGEDGPWLHCLHASCTTVQEINRKLRAPYRDPKPVLGASSANGRQQTRDERSSGIEWDKLSNEDLGMRPAAGIKKRRIEWLLRDRIPRNDYTLIAGRGKQGKSQWTMAFGAKISVGGDWWDRSGRAPQGHVLYLSAEDDPERIMIPRLEALGADLGKITILEAKFKIPASDGKTKLVSFADLSDLGYWRALFGRVTNPVLIVVDPLPSYMGRGVNDRRNSDVRAILGPFIDLVKEFEMTLVGVTHFGKAVDARTAADKVLDSIAYVNLARATHFIARDPDNPTRILFMPGPGNYARPDVAALAFTLVERTIPDEEGGQLTIAIPEFDSNPVEVEADDVVNRQSRVKATESRGPDPVQTTKLAIAMKTFLSGKGPVYLKELFDEFGKQGFLGHKKWNPKKNREEWSNERALYRAGESVEALEAPNDGWEVATSKQDPGLRSSDGRVRWALRRKGSTF